MILWLGRGGGGSREGRTARASLCLPMQTSRIVSRRRNRFARCARSSTPRWPRRMRVSKRSRNRAVGPLIPPERLLRAALLQALHAALGASARRTAGVRSSVALVCRAVDGRGGFRRLVHLQEPRASAERGHRSGIPVVAAGAAAGRETALRRAFFHRRNDAESLCFDEKLSRERRLGRAAGSGAQRRTRLQDGKALEQNPRLDHRQGCPAASQGQGAGEQACLSPSCVDGEPRRSRRRRDGDARERNRGARGGDGIDRKPARRRDAGRRQGLRCRKALSRI